jgi:hypothetical protein
MRNYTNGDIQLSSSSSSSSGITVLGGPLRLPKLCSTVLGPATYVSSSSSPSSLNLPPLFKPSHLKFFYKSVAFRFKKSQLSARIQFLHSKEVSQPHQSSFFYPLSYVQFIIQLVKVPCSPYTIIVGDRKSFLIFSLPFMVVLLTVTNCMTY